jgi:hypothetical protein
MRILGFDWDDTNLQKLEFHDLAPDDVEYLFELGRPYIFKHPDKPDRHVALGFAPGDRFVLVVFEHDRRTRWVRVVTAYEPTNENWWKTYRKTKQSSR